MGFKELQLLDNVALNGDQIRGLLMGRDHSLPNMYDVTGPIERKFAMKMITIILRCSLVLNSIPSSIS